MGNDLQQRSPVCICAQCGFGQNLTPWAHRLFRLFVFAVCVCYVLLEIHVRVPAGMYLWFVFMDVCISV